MSGVEGFAGGPEEFGRFWSGQLCDSFDGQQRARVSRGMLISETVEVLQALPCRFAADRARVNNARAGPGDDRLCLGREGAGGGRCAGAVQQDGLNLTDRVLVAGEVPEPAHGGDQPESKVRVGVDMLLAP